MTSPFSVPRVGIESSDGSMGLEMIEGETKEFCAVLMEPDECNIYMELDITLSSSSDTNTGITRPREEQRLGLGLGQRKKLRLGQKLAEWRL